VRIEKLDTLAVRTVALVVMAIAITYVLAFELLGQRMRFDPGAMRETQRTAMIEAVQDLMTPGAGASAADRPRPPLARRKVLANWQSKKPAFADIDLDGLDSSTWMGKALGRVPFEEVEAGFVPSQYLFSGEIGPSYEGPAPRTHGPIGSMLFVISLQKEPGIWLNAVIDPTPLPSPPDFPENLLPLFFVILMAGIAAWASQHATRPLRKMAAASKQLAANYQHTPIPEDGPIDVRQALEAFNAMGQQLTSLVAGQRQLLEAIGHDLRTPLTSLRLKTEMLSNPADRTGMTRTLDELQRLTEAALFAAASGLPKEEMGLIDFASLVASACEDFPDSDKLLTFIEPDERPRVLGRDDELTRAIRNVLDNALRYGRSARVEVKTTSTSVLTIVEDEGAGIPETELENVLEPLVRLEKSRNMETGGHGLGLHITRSIVTAHGGTIRLENRNTRGLRVRIELPRVQ
jgi:signal transduction histidine kinase